MIRIDAFYVEDPETGLSLTTCTFAWSATEKPAYHGPSRYFFDWQECGRVYPQTTGQTEHVLTHSLAGKPDPERFLWAVKIPSRAIFDYSDRTYQPTFDATTEDRFVKMSRAPACECCGANPWGCGRPVRTVTQAADGTWRCEKHIGRNPCAIEGCGKTRASKHASSDNYLCGAHWRLAPHRLKLVYRRLRRLAKGNQRKHLGDEGGWTDALNERYWRNWGRLIRETRLIVHPPAIETEILPSGPPPAALVAELARLGL